MMKWFPFPLQLSNNRSFDYAGLKVSAEIKELFAHIERFKPNEIELDTKLRPFIPDYIASVGDPDAFIKVFKEKS